MYITLCIAVCKQMAEEIGVMINELCIMHLLLAEETGVMINSLCIMQLLHVAVKWSLNECDSLVVKSTF